MKTPPSTSLGQQFDSLQVADATAEVATTGGAALGWLDTLGVRLGPNELRRRLWHFSPGVLALLGAAIPNNGPVPFHMVIAILVSSLSLAIVAVYLQRLIRRPGEQTCRAAIFGYLVSVLPLFVLFPRYPELGLAVTGIIAFGDGSATLVGLLWGSSKLPWNKAKSWAGTATFILVAFPMAALLYWGGSLTHVSVSSAFLCIGPTVAVAALFESLPVRFNDNFFVGACAAVTLLGMHALVVGWM